MTGRLHIDLETYSEAPIKKVGAYRYAKDPSTKILCMGWAVDDDEPELWRPGDRIPEPFKDPGLTRWAWNALFEIAVLSTLAPKLSAPLSQWSCSMALASYHGYPMMLAQAAAAVGEEQKDSAGGLLIRKCCTPAGTATERDYLDLFAYCLQDVRAERSVQQRMLLPALPEAERRIWESTIRSALYGTQIDLPLVRALQQIRGSAEQELNGELMRLTGLRLNQHGALAVWLGLGSVAKDALEAALALEEDPVRARAMALRLEGAKSSCAKLDAIEACLTGDQRIHGMVQYYGTHTGRMAGRLVQLQNLPAKTETKPTESTVRLALEHPDAVPLVYSPLDFCSAHIRSCLIASPGWQMYSGDYAQIEARVLATLAGSQPLLAGFRDPDSDIYTSFGARYGLDRAGGKTAILGLGFQMGPARFQQTCLEWGAGEIELELAQEVVRGYRESYPEIPQLWAALFGVSWNAVVRPGEVFALGGGLIKAQAVRGSLVLRLPSGRHLIYPEPKAAHVEKKWPDGSKSKVPEVSYMGRDSYTQRWGRKALYGGLITENVVQAVARDVMCEAMLRLEEGGFRILFTVHDEIVAESEDGRDEEFIGRMASKPRWLPGLPVDVEGGAVPRFGK